MTVTLRSNSGNSELIIDLESKSEYGSESGFDSSINLSSSHWDGEHTFPAGFKVGGIWIRRNDLISVRSLLSEWVGQPLNQLVASELIGEFQLARLPGQSFILKF